MNRLWIRLSLAFSAVVLISVALLIGLGIFLAQTDGGPPPELFKASDGLVDQLANYYRAHNGWSGVNLFLEGAESVFAPGPRSKFDFSLIDATGTVIYNNNLDKTAQSSASNAESLPIQIGDQVIGRLTIAHVPVPYKENHKNLFFLGWLADLVLAVAVVGGVVGITFGILMSRSLTAPLNRLAAAAQAIGERKLHRRVEASGSTEIIAVANAFNDMASALEEAETLRRNMVADVAHELRTPLSVLQGNLRAILDGVYTLDNTEIARLYDQTRVLSRLVNDLHELTLAEAHQLQLNLQPTDIVHLMENIAGSFEPVAEAEQVELKVQTGSLLPPVMADSVRLAQVLHNLLVNALRHTPSGGSIDLSAAQEDRFINLIIKDSGEGISQEHLPHVFERFYRADQARSRATGGAGLGLAIVRAIIEAHGGQVKVSSDGVPGHGTLFTIQLPVYTA